MHRKLMLTLILAIVFTAAIPAACFADITGDNGKVLPSVTVNIPVSHVIEGGRYRGSDRFSFTLHPESADNPMPEGTEDLYRTVTIRRGGDIDFGDIVFDYPGVYYYTVSRKSEKHERIKEDRSVFKVMIAAFNDGTSEMTVQKVGTSDRPEVYEPEGKEDEILFTDKYNAPPKTGDPFARIAVPVSAGMICLGLLLMMLNRRREEADVYKI